MNKKRLLSSNKLEQLNFLLPVGILISIFSLYPVLRGIYLGFTSYRVGRGSSFNGFQNYIGLYKSGYLLTTFKNLAFMILVSVIAIYLLGMILALLLNSKVPFRPLWRALLIIPWAVPPVAKVSMWKNIYNPISGHLDYFLMKLGIIKMPISWLSDPKFTIYTVILILIWGCIPFLALSLLASLQQIPKDIQEAAAIDGATPIQAYRFITLPYLNRATVISMSLIVVWIMNDFTTQFVLTNGGPGSATLTPIVEAYRQGFKYGNFGYSSAYGNMMIFCASILLFFYIRTMNSRDKGVN
jgi:multiple sugar transport system permease protein